LGKTSGSTQGRYSRHRQDGEMIFTMSFILTSHMDASKSNLTRSQAGDLGGLHFGDHRFGKTCWRGWQPPRLRFGRQTNELKTEDEA